MQHWQTQLISAKFSAKRYFKVKKLIFYCTAKTSYATSVKSKVSHKTSIKHYFCLSVVNHWKETHFLFIHHRVKYLLNYIDIKWQIFESWTSKDESGHRHLLLYHSFLAAPTTYVVLILPPALSLIHFIHSKQRRPTGLFQMSLLK